MHRAYLCMPPTRFQEAICQFCELVSLVPQRNRKQGIVTRVHYLTLPKRGMIRPCLSNQVECFSTLIPRNISKRHCPAVCFQKGVFLDASAAAYITFKLTAYLYKNAPCSVLGSIANPLPRSRATHYDVLGITQDASDTEIKLAYKKLVKLYHPDHAPLEEAEEYQKKFMEVRGAYGVLKDARRKATYDFEIKNSPYGRQWRNWRVEEKIGKWRGRNWETDQCWTS